MGVARPCSDGAPPAHIGGPAHAHAAVAAAGLVAVMSDVVGGATTGAIVG